MVEPEAVTEPEVLAAAGSEAVAVTGLVAEAAMVKEPQAAYGWEESESASGCAGTQPETAARLEKMSHLTWRNGCQSGRRRYLLKFDSAKGRSS